MLLVFIFIFVSGCEREEGCLDPSASNYDPSVDRNCCCEYPVLSARIFRTLGDRTYGPDSSFTDAGGNEIRILELRSYLSRIGLVTENDAVVNVSDSISIMTINNTQQIFRDDFVKIAPDQNLYQVGTIIADGPLKAIQLDVGVEESVNHSDPNSYPSDHPLSIQSDSMHINQIDGYKFMEIDLLVNGDSINYFIFGDENLVSNEINYSTTVTKAFDIELELEMDLEKLTSGIDFVADPVNTIQEKTVNNLSSTFSQR